MFEHLSHYEYQALTLVDAVLLPELPYSSIALEKASPLPTFHARSLEQAIMPIVMSIRLSQMDEVQLSPDPRKLDVESLLAPVEMLLTPYVI